MQNFEPSQPITRSNAVLDAEQAELTARMAEFLAAGGAVQQLDNYGNTIGEYQPTLPKVEPLRHPRIAANNTFTFGYTDRTAPMMPVADHIAAAAIATDANKPPISVAVAEPARSGPVIVARGMVTETKPGSMAELIETLDETWAAREERALILQFRALRREAEKLHQRLDAIERRL